MLKCHHWEREREKFLFSEKKIKQKGYGRAKLYYVSKRFSSYMVLFSKADVFSHVGNCLHIHVGNELGIAGIRKKRSSSFTVFPCRTFLNPKQLLKNIFGPTDWQTLCRTMCLRTNKRKSFSPSFRYYIFSDMSSFPHNPIHISLCRKDGRKVVPTVQQQCDKACLRTFVAYPPYTSKYPNVCIAI